MMKPLLLITVFAGTLMSTEIVSAAQDGMPLPNPPNQITHMQTKLGLSDAQVSQISAIESAQQEKMKALHDDFQAKVKEILSEEQATKLEQTRPQPGTGMMNGQRPPSPPVVGMYGKQPPQMQGSGSPSGDMVERMKSELGLTDDQAAQMDALQQQQRTQMEALRTETQELIKQVLTAEQAATFEQMRPEKPSGDRFLGNMPPPQ